MPIVGLTDRGARLPEIGKLFKGAKKEKKTNREGREYETFGKELDHWRFESREPEVAKAFLEEFGPKPQELPVYLPFPRTDDNFEAWHEAYTAGGLTHRCDGKTCVLWLDEKTGIYQTSPKPCPTLSMAPEKAKRDGCKPVARLKVIIPALNQIGCVTVETHSKNDILHFHAALTAYESLRAEGLRGIPMMLCRVQKEISTPGDGKRARRAKWLIEIKPESDWARKYLDRQRKAELAAVAETRLLTTSLTEEEEEEYQGEAVMDDGRGEILAEMSDLWEEKGKSAKDWPAYVNKELGNKSTDELGQLLLKWRAAPAASAAAAAKETVTV